MQQIKVDSINFLVSCCNRTRNDEIANGIFAVGSLQRVWTTSQLLTDYENVVLTSTGINYDKLWTFYRIEIDGKIYHSKSYLKATARNNFTVTFTNQGATKCGTILKFVKLAGKCHNISCREKKCTCRIPEWYFAVVDVLDLHHQQLPTFRGMTAVKHIKRVQKTNRYY